RVELADAKVQAMRGSVSAARRLSAFYAITHRPSDAIRWMTVAMENGDLDARFDLALQLSNAPDQLNRTRARFWFDKIVAEGDADNVEKAKYGIQNLDEIEAYRKAHP
ncbi:MAG TPA: hypothetical protein VHL34_15155, partial [Rhizomicrobium sp.]|nr:hypothetical protein [Rhizomicrobium sp.]